MSSFTVTLTGTSSELKTTFFPPLTLSSEYEWEVCLLDMTTYNSIPNVVQGVNNEFSYKASKNGALHNVSFPSGTYEIEDINTYLQEKMNGADSITLRANNNTLKTHLKSVYEVVFDYTRPTIAPLLGFTKPAAEDVRRLPPNKWHESNVTVDIIAVNVVQIKCNIVCGSYKNGIDDHVLHSFYPTVPPGFKIVEKPNNLIYLPVNINRIDTILITVADQNGDTVDFRGEEITVRIHVRPRAG